MYLNSREVEQANNKRNVIKKHFLKDVRYCNTCNGTGLSNFALTNDGSYIWDGVSFCDTCNGIGYLSWKETITEKLCPLCKGTGRLKDSNKDCPGCHCKGVVDWIQYIMLGGKRKEKQNDKGY